jgi:hypothetical protein
LVVPDEYINRPDSERPVINSSNLLSDNSASAQKPDKKQRSTPIHKFGSYDKNKTRNERAALLLNLPDWLARSARWLAPGTTLEGSVADCITAQPVMAPGQWNDWLARSANVLTNSRTWNGKVKLLIGQG